ncbi:MAG: uncharacterized protein KVP18_000137 [Porospora cf. gigantea A]|uniref:uncharacterized protein n=1 Tax=Porospora cf. gigantea A TaxID=2853593 RepID=UPI00355A36CF|nr:MAG: hypothetical protein KVP18_000137 [Porospora cf. gigantea A]
MLVAMLEERQTESAQAADLKRQGLRVVSDAEHLGMTRRILELRTANGVLEERCVRLQTDMVSVSGQANRLLRGFGFNSEVDRDAAIQRESLERLLQERESLFAKVARLTDEKAQMEEELDREVSLRQRVVDMARCVEEERMQTVIAHEEQAALLREKLGHQRNLENGLVAPPSNDLNLLQKCERLEEEAISKKRTIKEQTCLLNKKDKIIKKLEERLKRQTQQLEHLNWSLLEVQKENEDLRGFGICVGELRRKCAQLELEADQQKLSLDEAATAAGMAYEWRCAFQGLSQELSLIRSQTSADAEICMPEPLADPPKDLRREDTLDLWIEAEVDLTSASSAQQLKQELRGLQVVIQELQACLEEKELENTRITNELSELRRSLSRRTSESSEVLVFERLPPPQDGSLEARLRREIQEKRAVVAFLVKKYALSKEEVFQIPQTRPSGLFSQRVTPRVSADEWERLFYELQLENMRLKLDMKTMAESLAT